jgi:hypothetical protein
MRKTLIVTIALVAGLLASGSAQAGLITWSFEATIYDATPYSYDMLNINGETARISLVFDDTDVWTADLSDSGFLFFPSVAASASITGGHSVRLNTSTPAAIYSMSSNRVGFTQEPFNTSYVDLIIGSYLTQMYGYYEYVVVGPTEGGHLLPSHLTPGPFFAEFDLPPLNPDDLRYIFTDASVTISAESAPVPEPTTLSLLGAGLVAMLVRRRRSS